MAAQLQPSAGTGGGTTITPIPGFNAAGAATWARPATSPGASTPPPAAWASMRGSVTSTTTSTTSTTSTAAVWGRSAASAPAPAPGAPAPAAAPVPAPAPAPAPAPSAASWTRAPAAEPGTGPATTAAGTTSGATRGFTSSWGAPAAAAASSSAASSTTTTTTGTTTTAATGTAAAAEPSAPLPPLFPPEPQWTTRELLARVAARHPEENSRVQVVSQSRTEAERELYRRSTLPAPVSRVSVISAPQLNRESATVSEILRGAAGADGKGISSGPIGDAGTAGVAVGVGGRTVGPDSGWEFGRAQFVGSVADATKAWGGRTLPRATGATTGGVMDPTRRRIMERAARRPDPRELLHVDVEFDYERDRERVREELEAERDQATRLGGVGRGRGGGGDGVGGAGGRGGWSRSAPLQALAAAAAAAKAASRRGAGVGAPDQPLRGWGRDDGGVLAGLAGPGLGVGGGATTADVRPGLGVRVARDRGMYDDEDGAGGGGARGAPGAFGGRWGVGGGGGGGGVGGCRPFGGASITVIDAAQFARAAQFMGEKPEALADPLANVRRRHAVAHAAEEEGRREQGRWLPRERGGAKRANLTLLGHPGRVLVHPRADGAGRSASGALFDGGVGVGGGGGGVGGMFASSAGTAGFTTMTDPTTLYTRSGWWGGSTLLSGLAQRWTPSQAEVPSDDVIRDALRRRERLEEADSFLGGSFVESGRRAGESSRLGGSDGGSQFAATLSTSTVARQLNAAFAVLDSDRADPSSGRGGSDPRVPGGAVPRGSDGVGSRVSAPSRGASAADRSPVFATTLGNPEAGRAPAGMVRVLVRVNDAECRVWVAVAKDATLSDLKVEVARALLEWRAATRATLAARRSAGTGGASARRGGVRAESAAYAFVDDHFALFEAELNRRGMQAAILRRSRRRRRAATAAAAAAADDDHRGYRTAFGGADDKEAEEEEDDGADGDDLGVFGVAGDGGEDGEEEDEGIGEAGFAGGSDLHRAVFEDTGFEAAEARAPLRWLTVDRVRALPTTALLAAPELTAWLLLVHGSRGSGRGADHARLVDLLPSGTWRDRAIVTLLRDVDEVAMLQAGRRSDGAPVASAARGASRATAATAATAAQTRSTGEAEAEAEAADEAGVDVEAVEAVTGVRETMYCLTVATFNLLAPCYFNLDEASPLAMPSSLSASAASTSRGTSSSSSLASSSDRVFEGRESDWPELWQARLERIVSVIRNADVDVLCLQEVWLGHPAFQRRLSEHLGADFSFLGLPRTNGKADGVAILVRHERAALAFRRRVCASATPAEAALYRPFPVARVAARAHRSVRFHDAGDRVLLLQCLSVRRGRTIDDPELSEEAEEAEEEAEEAEDEAEEAAAAAEGRSPRRKGLRVVVGTTHLTFPHHALDEELRVTQVDRCLRELERFVREVRLQPGDLVVFAGDFNCPCDDARDDVAYQRVMDAGYASVHVGCVGEEARVTHVTHRGDQLPCDFVFARKVGRASGGEGGGGGMGGFEEEEEYEEEEEEVGEEGGEGGNRRKAKVEMLSAVVVPEGSEEAMEMRRPKPSLDAVFDPTAATEREWATVSDHRVVMATFGVRE